MQAIVLVDAAPGFEDAVASSLKSEKGVLAVSRLKDRNYDLAVLLDASEPDITRIITQRIPMVAGVKGVERMERADPDLLKQLRGA